MLRSLYIDSECVEKACINSSFPNFQIPVDMEIALVPKTHLASQYPGIFLFTSVARMIRPVKNLLSKTVEYIGSFEQVCIRLFSGGNNTQTPTFISVQLFVTVTEDSIMS